MTDPTGIVRWLAFDHPGTEEPAGLIRVYGDGRLEYLDRGGEWLTDPALRLELFEGRSHEVSEAEAARIGLVLRLDRS
jgi:hypothetical protein